MIDCRRRDDLHEQKEATNSEVGGILFDRGDGHSRDGRRAEEEGGRAAIDGDRIKIMNGHIIASWQSGDVLRLVL